jgi:hypothetical protein
MAMKYPSVATAEEIRAIAERSFALLDVLAEGDEDTIDDGIIGQEARVRRYHAQRMAMEALRFCTATAAMLGDVSLLRIVTRALEETQYYDDRSEDDTETIGDALRRLLELGATPTEEVEELSESEDVRVRQAVASGLQPHGARALKLLEKLARDPVAEVRRPAQESLAKARDVPWWMGKFSSDPLAGMSHDEAARLRGTLEQISAMLDQQRYTLAQRHKELSRVAAELPDPLAIDLILTTLSAGEKHERMPALGTLLISRKGGPEAFLRMCHVWSKQRDFYPRDHHAQMLTDAPHEARLATCLLLARFACAQPEDERQEMRSAAGIAADLAGKAFPPGEDVTPIVELLLALPPSGYPHGPSDWVVNFLGRALDVPGVDAKNVMDRFAEARLSGYPGSFQNVRVHADKLLLLLPRERLRRMAEEAIRKDDAETVRWGLARLTAEAYDPERDPPEAEMMRRFCDDPRLLRAILDVHDLRRKAAPWLRERLRRGELAFEDAVEVMEALGSMWGGAWSGFFMRPEDRTPEKIVEQQEKMREPLQAFLGPEGLQGPVTDAEWAAFRRVRDATKFTERRHWHLALSAVQPGPRWHPDDRALLDAALAHLEEDDDVALAIANGLALVPVAEDLPIFERLLARAPADDRSSIRRSLYDAREMLGLPEERAPGAGDDDEDDDEPRGGEWMDEEDDDT